MFESGSVTKYPLSAQAPPKQPQIVFVFSLCYTKILIKPETILI